MLSSHSARELSLPKLHVPRRTVRLGTLRVPVSPRLRVFSGDSCVSPDCLTPQSPLLQGRGVCQETFRIPTDQLVKPTPTPATPEMEKPLVAH